MARNARTARSGMSRQKGDIMRIEKYSDIYPLTIICDRYSGTYSGGKYLAFNLDFDEIPLSVSGDDVSCMEFWYTEEAEDYKIGKGSCIDEALDNLVELLNTEPRQTAD